MHLAKSPLTFLVATILLLPLVSLSGCGGTPGDTPEIVEVSGRVTLNGAPLPGFIVNFHPATGRPSVSSAPTDADGRYEMMYKLGTKGVKVDKHKVYLVYAPEGDNAAMDADEGKIPVDVKALMNKYGKENTELTIDVTPDQKEYNLELK